MDALERWAVLEAPQCQPAVPRTRAGHELSKCKEDFTTVRSSWGTQERYSLWLTREFKNLRPVDCQKLRGWSTAMSTPLKSCSQQLQLAPTAFVEDPS